MSSRHGLTEIPALSGFFRDSSYTATLEVLQNPDRGRKFATKDKRPLDPPPVIRLRIFRGVQDPQSGETIKREITDYPPHLIQGCVSHAEVFKAPPTECVAGPAIDQPDLLHDTPSHNPEHPSEDQALQLPPLEPSSSVPPAPETVPLDHQTGSQLPPADTQALFGTLVSQAKQIEYRGESILVFVFGDLAIRDGGHFVLRFTFFDLFSRTPGTTESPVLAQAYSTPFQVYATKLFPGLEASTELTRVVLAHGIPVHIRREARKRHRALGQSDSEDDTGRQQHE